MPRVHRSVWPIISSVAILISFLLGAFWVAYLVSQSAAAQSVTLNFGYAGMAVFAVIAGLSGILPLPAASLVPAFVEAGLSLPLLVVALVVGTAIADIISYLVGWYGANPVQNRYPKTFHFFQRIHQERRHLVTVFVFLYATFLPLPNEAIIIPLAIVRVPFRCLMIPLLAGNVISQTAMAYGFMGAFQWLLAG